MRIAAAVLVLIAAVAPSHAAAAPPAWPSLRGPSFDGHASGEKVVDAFPPQGPPVLWTRPLGAGYSGFAADGRRVFTQYQTLGGQYLLCLDAETGDTVWEHRYEGPYDPAGLYPGPRATPTLGEGRVYFSGPSGLVGCLDVDTGRPVWSLNVFERFGTEPVEFGYSCAPTLADGKVLLPVGAPGASVVALDPATGNILWQSGDDAASHVPILPVTFRDRRLGIAYLRNVLAAFDLATDELVWRKPLSSGYDEHAAWPIYSEPYLWISAPFQAGSELLELTDESPGYRTVWKSRLMSNDVCSSVLADGHLYGFDIRDAQAKPHRPSRGSFRCLEFLTARERWSNGVPDERRRIDDAPIPGGPIGQATALVADGKLLLFNELGELILARATPERYEELGRVRVLGGEIGWTQPTLCRGRLFVRNHSRAACLLLSPPEDDATPDSTLTVADIPQSTYRDWAAALIPVEPEYAMDAPTAPQLLRWSAAALALFLLSAFLAAILCFGVTVARRMAGRNESRDGPATLRRFRRFHWTLTAVSGAAGTTLFGLLAAEFLFTWPLCLFVAFQAAVYESRPRGDRTAATVRRGYVVLAFFAGVCIAYFLLCRRLSLAFEWTFLAGFPAAVPALLLSRRSSRHPRFASLREVGWSAVALAAYYAASAALLLWMYPS